MPTSLPAVIKGSADYRTYRPLKLDNGIAILLVHDKQSKHFAASVSVAAGASSDPRLLPGIAHFTEHMCFLGSKAYPAENEYKQYLAKNGGKSNASTSMSHTTYQFDVLAEHGEKALDIFSNFFVDPLFTKSGTQREVNAVDSENSKNLISDGRRRWQILKSLADDKHHFSKFSTGNRITLPACVDKADSNDNEKKDKHPLEEILKDISKDGKYTDEDLAEIVRATLLAFHVRHYRPHNMTAVMIGPQTLDKLEEWALPRFGLIPDRWQMNKKNGDKDVNNNDDSSEKWKAIQTAAAKLVEEASNDAPPVSDEETVEHNSSFRPELQGGKWPIVVTTKPIQSVRKLVLFFPLPPVLNLDKSATSVLSHLFGYEGKGSAFALLQDKGWISSLSAGNRISSPDQTLFQVQMNLTADGEEHWKDVVKVIFDYGNMLSNALNGDDTIDTCKEGEKELRRIWEEVATLDRIRFDQTSPGAVYSFSSSVAQSISKHGTEKCLSIGSMLNESSDTFPLDDVKQYIKGIDPSNCFIERCSQGAWDEMETVYKDDDDDDDDDDENNNSTNEFKFGKQTEKWYSVDYYVSPVDDEDVVQWESKNSDETSLHLPEPNRYIPRSLDLCADLPTEAREPRIDNPIEPPNLLVNKPNIGRLWHRLDDRYALPKSSVTILLRTATSENKQQSNGSWQYDPYHSIRSRFLTSLFADAQAQETYDAYIAGLGFTLSKSSSGFTLTVSGYSDRLSDFALKLLLDFCTVDEDLLKQHFDTTKDKFVRSLKSFFQSSRADSLALYYRNLLMGGKGRGIDENLEIAENMVLDDIVKHHKEIFSDADMLVECFYTGNVGKEAAEGFFSKVIDIINASQSKPVDTIKAKNKYIPGPLERRLLPGDYEIHFQSQNEKEENGATIVTFQSQREGFKGKSLSSEEALQNTAAVRLISKMIKEPVFNELRTKQQLGYIVSSYYDMDYSSRQADLFDSTGSSSKLLPSTTSIDSLVIYVLSRKEDPVEVANRIDDFLITFRNKLEVMPKEEIEAYADSLAKALTKPIRKLGTEASNHMGKIKRYAPETLDEGSGYSVHDIPWDNQEVLANSIRKLERDTILKVYDTLIVKKETRSRLTSFVYGNTHPLEVKNITPSLKWPRSNTAATSIGELMAKRNTMIPYDNVYSYPQGRTVEGIWRTIAKHKTTMRCAVAAMAVAGFSVWALKDKDNKKHK